MATLHVDTGPREELKPTSWWLGKTNIRLEKVLETSKPHISFVMSHAQKSVGVNQVFELQEVQNEP